MTEHASPLSRSAKAPFGSCYTDFDSSQFYNLRIGKRATLAEIDIEAWQTFAKDAGVGFSLLRRRFAELCEVVLNKTGTAAAELLAHRAIKPYCKPKG